MTIKARRDRKAFYDPQDEEDRQALTDELDQIEQDIRGCDDSDELQALRDRLQELNDGLTDDTRFRVQDLMRRIDDMTGGKSDGGERDGKSGRDANYDAELAADEIPVIDGALKVCIELGGYLQDIAGSVPEADQALQSCIRALLDRKRELEGKGEPKSSVTTKTAGAHAFYR